MRVLVVDDDEETRELVAAALVREGFDADLAASGREAGERARSGRFDVVVLDVMLGGESGLDVCAALRRDGVETPILFLSARGAVDARIEGLDAGGDDYLPKPFALAELCARVRALGRRGPGLRPERLRVGALVLDFAARRAQHAGKLVPVTAREWELLRVLGDARGRVVAFDDVLERAWGEASERSRASLEVLVARLRKKLVPIRTVRGVGYVLEPDPEGHA